MRMRQVDPRYMASSATDDITGRNRTRSDKWYYLAFEGETEFNYFGIIRDYKDRLGVRSNVGCIRLHRFDDEKDITDPKWIKNQVEEFRNGLCGKFTPRIFLKQSLFLFKQIAFDKLSKTYKNEDYTNRCKDLESKVHDLEDELLESISDEEYCIEGLLSDPSEAFSLIRKSLIARFPEFKQVIQYLTSPANKRLSEEDLKYDRFCVIVDRDYYSDLYRIDKEKGETELEYYDNLIDYFAEGDVSLYITNPQFEFWLILHFDDIRFDEDLMLSNPKIDGKRYAEKVISENIPGYNKYSLDKDLFIGKKGKCEPILRAVERVKENDYKTDLKELKRQLGSNIGLLIDEMRNQRSCPPPWISLLTER